MDVPLIQRTSKANGRKCNEILILLKGKRPLDKVTKFIFFTCVFLYFLGEELFNLWWLFFDEYYTTKIGFEINCLKFSGELITYLKKIKSCVLQDLVISYNWILRQDFKFILDHLKHLKHLTIFAPFGSEMNILDDISNSNCRLKVRFCQKILMFLS